MGHISAAVGFEAELSRNGAPFAIEPKPFLGETISRLILSKNLLLQMHKAIWFRSMDMRFFWLLVSCRNFGFASWIHATDTGELVPCFLS